jgi:uncharacterized protein with von Willebrand factor type A (vWA) domain
VFDLLLLNLRRQGLKVGMGEWLTFLEALRQGLATDLDGLYRIGRAVLVHKESDFDSWDLAFKATWEGTELPDKLQQAMADWLKDALDPARPRREITEDERELLRQFYERLKEQKERHDGGSYWVGTGGKSPFGRGGTASQGVVVGEGGSRSGIQAAMDREWESYRTDRELDHRDLQIALSALRNLAREGEWELDIDRTIDRTAKNAGDIELENRRKRQNRVHVRLILDTGGSMSPHTELVSRLFTAASEVKGFKTFETWHFHNVPMGQLYEDYRTGKRKPIEELLHQWPTGTRVVFVGDASMASYELFQPYGYYGGSAKAALSGLEWLQRIRRVCPASVWLNPDPQRWWDHPTVRAIGSVFPMFPLTLDGLRSAVKVLRRTN